jgi:tetratricopeptide (TPR) repeat protein
VTPALRTAALAALALLLGPLAASAAHQADGGSLEAFLKRMRAERDAEHARLAPLVQDAVKRLGTARTASETKKAVTELEALGSEAMPLLLAHLDPGASPKPEQEKAAAEVARILARSGNPALLDGLVDLATHGTPHGRALAIRVLGASPEVRRALTALHALHAGLEAAPDGALEAECVRSIARLDPCDPLVVAALADPEPKVLAAALEALASEPRDAPRPEVVALLAEPERAATVLPELVAYFCVPGQKLDEDIVVSLVRFACRDDLAPERRLEVLDNLPRFGTGLTSRLRKEIEPLTTTSDSAIKDAALIALTLMKDGRARRELMKYYDDQVKQNENWPLAYQRRGDVNLRIGEYRDAARDFQTALDKHGESKLLPGNRELWVSLARAHVKDGKLKPAADALEEFGLSSDLKRTLRADPDFQPLVQHSRYGSLFE